MPSIPVVCDDITGDLTSGTYDHRQVCMPTEVPVYRRRFRPNFLGRLFVSLVSFLTLRIQSRTCFQCAPCPNIFLPYESQHPSDCWKLTIPIGDPPLSPWTREPPLGLLSPLRSHIPCIQERNLSRSSGSSSWSTLWLSP